MEKNLVKTKYKHVPFGQEFEFEGITYIKTNFNRGYYYKKGRKIFRKFKKSKKVKTNAKFFDILPLTN